MRSCPAPALAALLVTGAIAAAAALAAASRPPTAPPAPAAHSAAADPGAALTAFAATDPADDAAARAAAERLMAALPAAALARGLGDGTIGGGELAASDDRRDRAIAVLAAAVAGAGDRQLSQLVSYVAAAGLAPPLRDRLLWAIGARRPGVDFARLESLAAAWGALPRRSASRELSPGAERLTFAADDGGDSGDAGDAGAIAASIFSLPSAFFDAEPAAAFLAGVRRADPRRTLVALTDLPLRLALAEPARRLGVTLLETYGRPYSPWPRDPFTLARGRGQRVVALLRPNLQPGREADSTLGIELVRDLPPALDAAWGGARWERAAVPFHNGQLLLAGGAVWMSLHSLEPRILALLGLARVPVESFATAAGIGRYLAAARRAAAELAALYGRPARFVHPLPAAGGAAARGADAERAKLMTQIGGGAGYDLDSLVTFLPAVSGDQRRNQHQGRERALVADVTAGRALLAGLGEADWRALAATYDLAAESLPRELAAAQQAPRPTALAGFLELVARQLEADGLEVRRLPLVFVPTALLRDRRGVAHPDFLLGWNNVVVERRDGSLRAEGFAAGLPAGDSLAGATFAAAGAHLDLLPPLVHSVVLNGGYRCASNHLRAP